MTEQERREWQIVKKQMLNCKERIDTEMKNTMDTLRTLWELYRKDPEAYDDDLGNWLEYGLAFDYVASETFTDQRIGYFRYQISYGGPSEEFRFYTDRELNLDRIEYWFLDWFDGAYNILTGEDFSLLEEIFEDFKEIGMVESEFQNAMDC